jgi:hypothetical protein
VLRHCQWRRTFLSRATVNGAAKKGYSSEKKIADGLFFRIVLILGYFCLNRQCTRWIGRRQTCWSHSLAWIWTFGTREGVVLAIRAGDVLGGAFWQEIVVTASHAGTLV